MVRIPFDSVFIVQPPDTLVIKQKVRVNGISYTKGVVCEKTGHIGGVSFSGFTGQDLAIDIDGDEFVVRGIYNK